MKNSEITKKNLELVDDMLKRVKEMEADEIISMIDKMSVFRNYSFGNQVILAFSGAVNVMGFHQWKKVGRSVKKGSKAIWILAPMIVNVEKEKENGEAEILTHLICKKIGIDRKSDYYLHAWRVQENIKESMEKINRAYIKFMEALEG